MILPRILVIDDQLATEADTRESFCSERNLIDLEKPSQRVIKDPLAEVVFTSGQIKRAGSVDNSIEEVLKAVEPGWGNDRAGWRWALVLLDLHFASSPPRDDEDEEFGLRALEALVRRWPDSDARPGNTELPIVMLSSRARVEKSPIANRIGARAYVEKPELTPERLTELLNEHGLIRDQSGKLKGSSYALMKVLREARKVAQMGAANAMILGPQGSGKSSLALYLHEHSRPKKAPFIRFFSSPGASQLEYANLFGCWKGAHNQAEESSIGAAERADQGTLLIDEVHNLTSDNQQELLQFGRLDENGRRWLRRLGNYPTAPDRVVAQALKSVRGELDSTKTRIAVDVILLSATNEPLDDPQWRSANGFSEPLYTRLAIEHAGSPMRFPSLVERRQDIPELFESFVNRETKRIRGRTQDGEAKLVDDEVRRQLMEYDWPGNVAELEGVARAVARNARDFAEIFARHLPPLEEARFSPSPSPSLSVPVPDRRVDTLAEAERSLRNSEVPRSRTELQGSLASLEQAYGQLIKEVIEEALVQENVPGRHSREVLLPVLHSLFGDEIKTATQAYGKLKKLNKLFWKHDPPKPESLLAKAILRAEKNRNPKSQKSKRKSAAD